MPAAVDSKVLCVEKLPITQTDSRDKFCDIFGGAPSVQEGFSLGAFEPSLGGSLSPLRLDPTWVDAIDTKFWSKAFGEAFREGAHGGFDGAEVLTAIAFHPLVGLIPSDMDHRGEDSMRSVLAKLSLGDGTAQEHHCADIEVPEFGEFLFEGPGFRCACKDIGACGVDPEVDVSSRGKSGIGKGVEAMVFSQVGDDAQGLCALRGGSHESVDIAAGMKDQVATARSKFDGDGLADPTGGTGDHSDQWWNVRGHRSV